MSDPSPGRKLTPVPFDRVSIEGDFWPPRMKVNREVTLRAEYRMLKDTGRIDAFLLDWKPGMEPRPHYFWDSDVAKWVEAASYSLATHPDPELESLLEEVVGKIAGAQQPDGYLNVYFTVVEPQMRWKNLRDYHELYCAGHLMEAAVAHFQATGRRTLLDVLTRYADHIDSVFGDASGKRYGTPGHEEIELALVKLYHVTGEERALRLAEFFLNQRGQQPSVLKDQSLNPDNGRHHQGCRPGPKHNGGQRTACAFMADCTSSRKNSVRLRSRSFSPPISTSRIWPVFSESRGRKARKNAQL